MGKELTLMVAQPMPARLNTAYMMASGEVRPMKMPAKNAEASMMTPARMAFFRPILEETIPTGM